MTSGAFLLRAIWAAALLLLAACASTPPPAARGGEGPLILVSIDGFRADYLDRGLTPTLKRLAGEGVRAKAMRPSYPSNTFPNHYTLVTGLRPDRHGIVQNTMEDPAKPGVTFSMGNRAAVQDGEWWAGAEPIWITAERAGLRTAPVFWPGSEAEIGGLRPSVWRVFDHDMPEIARVDALLGLLDWPPAARPRFLTLYFNSIDDAGHASGPDSPELDKALGEVDVALARLLQGLAQRGLSDRANLVIVSDHGMAAVPPEGVIYLDERYPGLPARMIANGAAAGFSPLPGREAEAERILLAPHDGFACWRRDEVPARWRYGRHPRVPAIVCQAEVGRYLTTRARDRDWTTLRGQHGFDPFHPSMAALFVAHGPAFRRGVVLEPFDNLDVYPLLARVLGVPARPGDGRRGGPAGALAR